MELDNFFFEPDDYTIADKPLGKGSFGKVYVAFNKVEKKSYAIKILKPEEKFTGKDQMSLMRESMILHKLKHPGIVRFIGVNFLSLKNPEIFEPSIITEYLPNGSLRNILDKEQACDADYEWTPTKKYISLYGIANALKYLHENKIIHRDVKPENILIDQDYNPRICDFGLSRCFPDALTKSGKMSMTNFIGTPLYMAPELLKGEHYNSSVDVYAYSILAYEIITGKKPFYELGKIECIPLLNKIMRGYRPKFTPFVTTKMKNLLMRCWSEKIEERPTFAEICELLKSDTSYFDEDIDEDEFNEYVEYCDEMTPTTQNQTFHINEVEKDNKKSIDSVVDDDLFRSLDELLGDAKERNPISSANHLLMSSEKGNCVSSYILGLLYESGHGVEQDFKRAKYYFKKSALRGNSNGFYRIGLDFYLGHATSHNYSKAFKYFQKAEKMGSSRGMGGIGLCYLNGEGVKQDYTKAFEYYQKSSELGNSYAMRNLGLCYSNGEGVKQDYTKAFEYYQKSSELGNSYAMCNLGLCYSNGRGVKQDYTKAIEYYQKSSELGNSYAMRNLGNCYSNGRGVKQDYTKAFEYYQKSSELGNSDAMCNLGNCYSNGEGVKQDYTKAFEYYQKSSELGNSDAMFNLGLCYSNGEGVKQDYTKAFEYYQKSSELGNSYAMCNLGNCYFNGRGVKQDYKKAIEYYQKSADLGNDCAKKALIDLKK